jgi:SAM-dependent methyltransferase
MRRVAVEPEIPAAGFDPELAARFACRVVEDLGAFLGAALACVGDTLGLYRAMARSGPVAPDELATMCGVSADYASQWLVNQAAGGYVRFDSVTRHFTLPPEHAAVLTDDTSRHYLGQAFQAAYALLRAQPELFSADYEPPACCARAHANPQAFLLPGATKTLIERWVPALEGVGERLQQGARAADAECGCGSATVALAEAYPNSHVFGFDPHAGVLRRAQERARQEHVADRVTFELAAPEAIPNHRYCLVVFRSGLTGMQDPLRAARRALRTVDPDGSVLIVEPLRSESIEAELHGVGRMHSALAALKLFPPTARATPGAPRTPATDSGVRALLSQAGFGRVSIADETPFARVFDARP